MLIRDIYNPKDELSGRATRPDFIFESFIASVHAVSVSDNHIDSFGEGTGVFRNEFRASGNDSGGAGDDSGRAGNRSGRAGNRSGGHTNDSGVMTNRSGGHANDSSRAGNDSGVPTNRSGGPANGSDAHFSGTFASPTLTSCLFDAILARFDIDSPGLDQKVV